jgi:hypothetical protein
VEQTRIQFSTTLSAALEPVQKDIADLRRVQYEQAGKVAAGNEVNPNASLIAAVEALRLQQSQDLGAREANVDHRTVGQSNRTFGMAILGAGIAAFGLFITIAGIAIAVIVG